MSETNNQLADNLIKLTNLYLLQNILLQIQKNLTLIEEGSTGLTITVNGGSLFQLAAQYYQDPTRWTTIANANGLSDPELPPGQPIQLVIPAQSTDSGGIYQP